MVLAPVILGEEAKNASKTVNVGFIGVGTQGRVLLTNALKIPNLRFVGVADIWPYNQGYAVRTLKKYNHPANGYIEYAEMLDKEKDIDAVIVATPDWKHAECTVAALKAGKHVYCEKEMSNDIALAKEMVVTSQQTKKLLQIGHQRRSNPRYQLAIDYMQKKNCCGMLTFLSAGWSRSKRLDVGWPKGQELDEAALKKYGYDTMARFRNWRWYKKFSGGPIADLGSHQIDIFNWALKASPAAVMAAGGCDFYEGIEWYDNISALYEWDNVDQGGKKHTVRGYYQLLSTSSHGGYSETFIGTDGSLIISENAGTGGMRREQEAAEADWEKELPKPSGPNAAPAAAPKVEEKKAETKDGAKKDADDDIKVGHSVPAPGRYFGPITVAGFNKSEHLPHIENFIAAIREGAALTCPGEVGYDTAVTVLKVNDAIVAAKRLEFKPEEFKA